MGVSAPNVTDFDACDVQTPVPVDPDVDSRKQVDPITHSVVKANCRRGIDKELATNGALAPKYPQHGMVLSVAAFSHYISNSRVGTSVLPPDPIIGDHLQWCEVCCIYFSKDNATSHKLGEDYNRRFESIKKNMNTDPNAASYNPGKDKYRVCEGNADPFPRCELCNVHCTDKNSLAQHKKGKKHRRNLLASKSMKTPEKNKKAVADKIKQPDMLNFGSGINPMVLPRDSKSITCERDLSKAKAEEINSESDPNENQDDRSTICDIFNINPPNIHHIMDQNMGKKHNKELKKLEKKETIIGTPAPTVLIPGPTKNTEVIQGKIISHALGVDTESKNCKIIESNADGIEPTFSDYLENKKGSILEGDVVALPKNFRANELEGVRIRLKDDRSVMCEICNIIVPNNSAVITHNSGKKHLKKKRKLEKKVTKTSTSAKTLLIPDPTKNNVVILDKTEEMKNETATKPQVLGVDSDNKTSKIIESSADGIEPTFSDDLENKKQSILERYVVALPENISAKVLEGVRIRLRDGHSVMCEICNVLLPNVSANIVMHNTGNKHLKEMMKLGKKETDTSALVTTDLCPGLTKCPGVIQGKPERLKKGSALESQVPRVDSKNKKRKVIEGDATVGNRIDRVSCGVLENKKQKIMERYAEKDEVSEVLPEDTKNSDLTNIMADPLEEVHNIDCPSHSFLVEPKRKKRRCKMLNNNIEIAATTVLLCGPTKNAEVSRDKTEEMKNETATEPQVLGVDSDNKTCKIIESSSDGIEPTFSDDLENKKQSILERYVVALPENISAKVLEGVRIRLRDGHSVMCEICNVLLPNVSANIVMHNTGNKHLKEMMKLGKKETDTSALVTTDLCPGLTKGPGVIQGKPERLKKGNALESQVPRVDSKNKKRKIIECDATVGNRIDRVSCKVLENKKQKIVERYAEKNELSEVLPEDTKNSDLTKIMADPLEEVRNIDCPSHPLLVEPRRKGRQPKMLKNNMKIAACTSASTHAPVTAEPLIIAEVSQVSNNENAILTEGLNNEFGTDSQALEIEKPAVMKEIGGKGVCNKSQRSWFPRNPFRFNE